MTNTPDKQPKLTALRVHITYRNRTTQKDEAPRDRNLDELPSSHSGEATCSLGKLQLQQVITRTQSLSGEKLKPKRILFHRVRYRDLEAQRYAESCALQLLLGVFEGRKTIVVIKDRDMGNSLLSTLSYLGL